LSVLPELLKVGAGRRGHAEQLVGLVDDDAYREVEDETGDHRLGQNVETQLMRRRPRAT